MAKLKANGIQSEIIPMLKTVEQMSRISGIGINKLRELMEKGEIEYVENGNRKLLVDDAVLDWYKRNRVMSCSERSEQR